MVGILLVTHNGLGNSFVDCIQHVLGCTPDRLKVLSVLAADDPQQKLAEGQQLIDQLDTGDGVLMLVDVYGATPSNIAQKLCQEGRVTGVSGLSFPMLLRVVCSPAMSLAALAKLAFDGARECIVYLDQEH
ncbi:MAG: PTS fructose transporter subunit IIA [Gallionella sp.]|nr:PTS fructose transporter subunit IIA [Gallionella sp.]MDD4959181.1 PTS fructose transporter subunit IIA [Gallionella sp.]